MNPLTSIPGTIISGFILAILIVLGLGMSGINALEIQVWLHVLAGVVWKHWVTKVVLALPRSINMSHRAPCCGSAGVPL